MKTQRKENCSRVIYLVGTPQCLDLTINLLLSGVLPFFNKKVNTVMLRAVEPYCVLAKSLQSCPSVCDSMNCSLPDSSIHGILQARVLEWVAMPSSRRSSQPRNRTCVSYISCTAGEFFTTSATWEA